MKIKILLSILAMFLIISGAFAQTNYTIKAGVSIDSIPKEFYGTWRVSSKLLSTNSQGSFKENNIDLWNLSRSGNVITLDNPFSGAHASITMDEVKGHFIKFKKIGDYEGQKLTDSVKINLAKDTFTGVNNVKLEMISEEDGHVMKSQWAVYSLKGEKISGDSIKK